MFQLETFNQFIYCSHWTQLAAAAINASLNINYGIFIFWGLFDPKMDTLIFFTAFNSQVCHSVLEPFIFFVTWDKF